MDTSVNADRSQTVIVHSQQLPWIASPERGVERRLLERSGAEVALATSVVRYAAGARFSRHVHGGGEEFLVLEGTFSDETGDHPAGTYVRNPPGSSHAPFSDSGCVIFVKLRQMRSEETAAVRIPLPLRHWQVDRRAGIERALLYADARSQVELVRLPPGGRLPARRESGGEEIFVVQGSVEVPGARVTSLETWSWRRSAAQRQPALVSGPGALLWLKRGHL